ncbi:hypothetical protein [Saccharothrix sp. NRRL B-16348]|uniref:hypothetical protein n=1 Tax=Saccharothrix sp. NRRL B-16348 TaxID=1415542 RepID=UPI000ADD721F|nr:hypothetical protein [Saccharothrix sp. NRRL B-16348]
MRKNQQGYKAIAVPPSLTIVNSGDIYQHVREWIEALDNCLDMADSRRELLKNELRLLCENPDAYVRTEGGLRLLKPCWL